MDTGEQCQERRRAAKRMARVAYTTLEGWVCMYIERERERGITGTDEAMQWLARERGIVWGSLGTDEAMQRLETVHGFEYVALHGQCFIFRMLRNPL